MHERFGRKVAIFVCLLAHSASKMVLLVPPGDFRHLAACPRWRARVPLPSVMMVGPASLALGESLEDLRFLPGGARTRPPVGHWVSWLCLASLGASRPHRAALSSWCLPCLPRQATVREDGVCVKCRAPAWLSCPLASTASAVHCPHLPGPLLRPPGFGRTSRGPRCARMQVRVPGVFAVSLSSHTRFCILVSCTSACQQPNVKTDLMPAGAAVPRVSQILPGAPLKVLEGMARLVLQAGVGGRVCARPAWEVLAERVWAVGREGPSGLKIPELVWLPGW